MLDTEITPELVPVEDGAAPQSTEAKVGPYALQDFSLFHVLRYGFRPVQDRLPRPARLVRRRAPGSGRPASRTSGGWPTRPGEIRHWLEVFVQRFFAFSQFKRSALPNGPKVSAGGSLSPRGDWRAPSDASAAVWLDELRRNVPES